MRHPWLLLPTLLLLACKAAPAPQEHNANFPSDAVHAALDQPTQTAIACLIERYPDARLEQGPLKRLSVSNGGPTEELILFQDVRSGRVNSVVVKFNARLTDIERRAVLRSTHVEGMDELGVGEVRERKHKRLMWRARWADRQGRLTITVEAPQGEAPTPPAPPTR